METVFLIVLGALIVLASLDLWVGVANDAVNFINSAVGAHVATVRTILGVAVVGVVLGALLSGGMMEVARKGIFDPRFFYTEGTLDVPAILAIYVGVVVTDVVMLDAFNTYGLPTSTTVSLVSALLGASVAVAFFRSGGDVSQAAGIVQGASVAAIYSAIFLSVAVAFLAGAGSMFLARLLFTWDLAAGFRRWGWLWTGLTAASLSYFVVFKGLKHAPFLGPEVLAFANDHLWPLLGGIFAVSAATSALLSRRHVTVFRVLILLGTAALAMAFAGNDLVNFIGPTVAAGHAVLDHGVDLSGKVASPGWALLVCGVIMGFALWFSKKARTVTDTEVRLASSGSGHERFQPSRASTWIARAAQSTVGLVGRVLPSGVRHAIHERTLPPPRSPQAPPYDLLRASVNLTVSTTLVALGTANKLPLSTTYVTFMVAMGAALADREWGSDVAPARIQGLASVTGGWLVTGALATIGAFLAASVAYLAGPLLGTVLLIAVVVLSTLHLRRVHHRRSASVTTVFDSLRTHRPA